MKFDNPYNYQTDAMLGVSAEAMVASETAKARSELGYAIAEYNNNVAEMSAIGPETAPDPAMIAERAEAEFWAAAENAVAELIAASREQANASQSEKIFRFQHNLFRNVIEPDGFKSGLKLFIMTSVESLATATFFLTGGFVSGPAQALGFGAMIAGTTTVLSSLVGGGLFGRLWNYGVNARMQDTAIVTKRWLGRIGSIGTALTIGGVITASALVRSTGEPDKLSFTFENFAAAATNFNSIMLAVVGTSFALLAWRTGLRAFDDPYPGFSQACAATRNAHDYFKTSVENAFVTIDGINQDAMDDLAAMADDVADRREDLQTWREDVLADHAALKSDIDAAATAISQKAAEFQNFATIVTPGENRQLAPALPLVNLDDLKSRIAAPVLPPRDNFEGFSKAHKAATARIARAYSAALDRVSAASDSATGQSETLSAQPTPALKQVK
ncbi:hypothetical protein [uncultured Roseibium sp.]|uniref:hypothetical protein n=1 Tax=uncultured Roseibium sp. TaxID=1936171 RepID=UPI002632C5A8|nr:hypothetical protein [uncultured Roseibium sp.]